MATLSAAETEVYWDANIKDGYVIVGAKQTLIEDFKMSKPLLQNSPLRSL